MSNPEHVRWLLEGVKFWNRRHQKLPGEGYPFEPDFESAQIYREFWDADKLDSRGNIPLAGADFWDANLDGAELQRADLSGADLTLATLVNANLWLANLTDANLVFANLTGANLTASEPWRAALYFKELEWPKQFERPYQICYQ